MREVTGNGSNNVRRLRSYLGFEAARHLVWRRATLPPDHPSHLPAIRQRYRMLGPFLDIRTLAFEAEVFGPEVRDASSDYQQGASTSAKTAHSVDGAVRLLARDYDYAIISQVARAVVSPLDVAATTLAAAWHEDEMPVVRLQLLQRAADHVAATASTLAGGDALLAALALVAEIRSNGG